MYFCGIYLHPPTGISLPAQTLRVQTVPSSPLEITEHVAALPQNQNNNMQAAGCASAAQSIWFCSSLQVPFSLMALGITFYIQFRASSELSSPKPQFEHFAKAAAATRRGGFVNFSPFLLLLLSFLPGMFSLNLGSCFFSLSFLTISFPCPLQAAQLSVLTELGVPGVSSIQVSLLPFI